LKEKVCEVDCLEAGLYYDEGELVGGGDEDNCHGLKVKKGECEW